MAAMAGMHVAAFFCQNITGVEPNLIMTGVGAGGFDLSHGPVRMTVAVLLTATVEDAGSHRMQPVLVGPDGETPIAGTERTFTLLAGEAQQWLKFFVQFSKGHGPHRIEIRIDGQSLYALPFDLG